MRKHISIDIPALIRVIIMAAMMLTAVFDIRNSTWNIFIAGYNHPLLSIILWLLILGIVPYIPRILIILIRER